MELQGLHEALKVEIQCHQVNEASCYYVLIGVCVSDARGEERRGEEKRRTGGEEERGEQKSRNVTEANTPKK